MLQGTLRWAAMGLLLVLLVVVQIIAGLLSSTPWMADAHAILGLLILALMAAAQAGAWKYRTRFGTAGVAMTAFVFLLTLAGTASGIALRAGSSDTVKMLHGGLGAAVLVLGLAICAIVAAQVRKAGMEPEA